MSIRPRWFTYLLAAVVGFVLVAPTIVVVGMSVTAGGLLSFPPKGFSLRWYDKLLGSPAWIEGMLTSLQIAVLTTILATVLGTMAAVAIVRGRFRFARAVNAFLFSPMIVPVVVIALGMYLTYGRVHISGSVTGLVVAHTTLAIPFVVINVAAGLRTVDWDLVLAARSLGAGPLQTFMRVIAPLVLPSILAGALFAFMTSWDELVIAIFLSSPLVKTLPVVMWEQVRSYVDPTIAAVATMLTVVTIVSFLLLALLNRRLRKVS
ncbi:MAG: ABC transporter permease subunit [Streptosporangiales bacterium]|nr:ABC transporter permease subunit [Streptosporangiales bacterium]